MSASNINKTSLVAAKISILAALALPLSAIAQQDIAGKKQGYDFIANAYSEMYKVPVVEAQRRLARRPEILALQQRLQKELPDTFAGLYMEHTPEFRVVVRLTGDARTTLSRYTNDPLFVAESAPRSLKVLKAAQKQLSDQMMSLGTEFMSGLDVKSSAIDLHVREPLAVTNRVKGLSSASGFIKVHKTDRFIQTTDMVGGAKLNLPDGINYCTSGFNVYDPTVRELGLVTAGHCNDSLIYDSPSVGLTHKGGQNVGSYDIQWHQQTSTTGTLQKQKNEIKIVSGPQSTMTITGTTPSSAVVLNEVVCKSGATIGYRCGNIVDISFQDLYQGQAATWVRVHNAGSTQKITDRGDSGGPVFGTNSAYGIIHGRGADGTTYVNDLLYMPVERFATLGVSVLTEPFEITSLPGVAATRGGPSVTVSAHFKGVPKFPVKRAVTYVICPSGSTCTNGTQTYTANIPSPFTWNASCSGINISTPTVSTWRAIFTDASGIATPPVEYTITCLPSTSMRSMDNSGGTTIGDEHAN